MHDWHRDAKTSVRQGMDCTIFSFSAGEQIANMLPCVMPRRPNLGKEHILSREDLQQLRHSLAHLSMSAVRDIYERVYQECRITSRDFPPARAMQELVQAWKQLRKWRR